jgi:hypothetical protein
MKKVTGKQAGTARIENTAERFYWQYHQNFFRECFVATASSFENHISRSCNGSIKDSP